MEVCKQTYEAVPGDMRRASVFFPNCASAAGSGIVNCNGNGDGYVSFNMGNAWDGDAIGDEPAKVFRHLNQSGIYEKGGSTQLTNGYSSFGSFPLSGYHAFSETIDDMGYVVVTVDGGGTGGSAMPAGSIYFSGGTYLSPSFDNYDTAVYMLSSDGSGGMDPLTAYSIDQKIDDGSSAGGNATGATTGKFRTTDDVSGFTCVTGDNYGVTLTNFTRYCVPGLLLQ